MFSDKATETKCFSQVIPSLFVISLQTTKSTLILHCVLDKSGTAGTKSLTLQHRTAQLNFASDGNTQVSTLLIFDGKPLN